MVKNAVEVRGLVVDRGGRRVLDGLDLTIPEGGVVGLLGPSGCGKSTLLRCLVGVQRTVSGSVRGARHRRRWSLAAHPGRLRHPGRQRLRRPERRREPPLLRPRARRPPRRRRGVRRGGRPHRPGRLGGRPAQRWPALAGEPGRGAARTARTCSSSTSRPSASTPCCDVTSGALFHRLADDGATVLVSSHVMDEADRCDRLLLMREGRIIADDTPDRIRETSGTADIEQRVPGDRGGRRPVAAPTAAGASHEPPDHARRRRPGAHPAAPRPAHAGHAARAAVRPDHPAVVDVRGLAGAVLRPPRTRACWPCSRSSSCSW